MRLDLLTVSVLLCSFGFASQNAKDNPSTGVFELQGDKLGDSLDSRLSHHPKAQCIQSTNSRKSCYQWSDVCVFGIAAHADPSCSPEKSFVPTCAQGLIAQLVDGRLNMLTYTVEGKDKTKPVAELKKKYGSTLIDTREGAIWSRGQSTMSVTVGPATENSEGPSLITFLIQDQFSRFRTMTSAQFPAVIQSLFVPNVANRTQAQIRSWRIFPDAFCG